jgi:hypothetical protein
MQYNSSEGEDMSDGLPQTAPIGSPVPLSYYIELSRPFLPLIKTLRLLFQPIYLWARYRTYGQRMFGPSAYLGWSQKASVTIAIALSIWLLIAAIKCLRPGSSAHRALLLWAYVSLAFVLYGILANTLYRALYSPRDLSNVAMAGWELEQFMTRGLPPLVVALLFRRREIKQTFDLLAEKGGEKQKATGDANH